MAAKCDMCGKMTNKYHMTPAGDVVCQGFCLSVYRLESYLLRLEVNRERDEEHNKLAYQHAREMAGWLSLFKHGNKEMRKRATKAISAFM